MPKGKIVIDPERCKGCGICVATCPFGVLEMTSAYNTSGYPVAGAAQPDQCTGCALCAQACPDIAIEVYREVGSGTREGG